LTFASQNKKDSEKLKHSNGKEGKLKLKNNQESCKLFRKMGLWGDILWHF
jgi:hypothetical protein